MPVARRVRRPAHKPVSAYKLVSPEELTPDKANPRKPDPARLGLLRMSIAKLGFLMPVYRQRSTGLLLSGHQRLTVSKELERLHLPVEDIDVEDKDIMGINMLFNRFTNDFNAFDTGKGVAGRMDIQDVIERLESLPDHDPANDYAINCKLENVRQFAHSVGDQYDKKSTASAGSFIRRNIRIPVVVSESGTVVNGVHRIFAALEYNEEMYPVVRIPDEMAEVALILLNYLSMDFHVDEDFKNLLRAGAYRRVANNRGLVTKSYRFWANGCRTLLDAESYTREYWINFRQLHGHNILDFGAGLCKVAPYLRTKGMNALDFEPYRVDPDLGNAEPSPDYSRSMARQFLQSIADPKLKFDSVFLSAVLNSVPFPEDRLKVLAIVHALCGRQTAVYGTYRHISDFEYEYGGIRNAGFFVFDSEPGVRLGDIASRPKIQKFMNEEEADSYFKKFWMTTEHWRAGNISMFKLTNPRTVNLEALGVSLDFEFEALPFRDKSTMGLGELARSSFEKRLGRKIP